MTVRIMVWQCDRCGRLATELTSIGGYGSESIDICDECKASFDQWKKTPLPGEDLSRNQNGALEHLTALEAELS